MRYSKEQITQLDEELTTCLRGLFQLQARSIEQTRLIENPKAKEYLTHGVNRRIITLRHALAKIFMALPLEMDKPASREEVLDAQVNLYAFLIGIVGTFDNFAWAYAYTHDMIDLLARRQSVDLFKMSSKNQLPPEVSAYLTSSETKSWYEGHFKGYRDSLAHRIPPYIPSVFIREQDSELHQQLSSQRMFAQAEGNRKLVDQMSEKISRLEHPNITLIPSFDPAEGSKPVLLHPQVLCDSATLIEFGNLFFDHWAVRI